MKEHKNQELYDNASYLDREYRKMLEEYFINRETYQKENKKNYNNRYKFEKAKAKYRLSKIKNRYR